MKQESVRPWRFYGSLARSLPPWTSLAVVGVFSMCPILSQEPEVAIGTGKDPVPLARVVSTVLPAVVRIEVDAVSGKASGTGFLVSGQGLIATAAHLLKDAKTARVTLHDGDVYDSVTILESDGRHDLAVIKIKGFGLPSLTLRDSSSVEVGERLIVIGNPAPGSRILDWTTTDGLLSAIRREEGHSLFQISVPVTHGSSGSPVLDSTGKVVGLVVAGYPGEDFNFATPANYLAGVLEELRALPPDSLASRGRALSQAAFESTSTVQSKIEFPPEPAFDLKAIQHVAVIPFTVDGLADDYITNYFAEQLGETKPRWKVIDAIQISLHFEGEAVFKSDAPIKSLLAAARAVKAEAVLLGTGSRYVIMGYPGVTLDLKLIEVNKGNVLWSVSGQSTGGGFSDAQAKKMAVRSVTRKIPD